MEGNSLLSATVETSERISVLSLVKLTKSGLLLFTFSRDTSFNTVSVVSDVLRSLESEGSASPQYVVDSSFTILSRNNTIEKKLCFFPEEHYIKD